MTSYLIAIALVISSVSAFADEDAGVSESEARAGHTIEHANEVYAQELDRSAPEEALYFNGETICGIDEGAPFIYQVQQISFSSRIVYTNVVGVSFDVIVAVGVDCYNKFNANLEELTKQENK